MRPNHYLQSGFTLVEMIMVIIITGIIGAMVAVFLKAPVQQYLDIGRRAEMTDIADTALRRIARDMRTAVPNSVRLPTLAGSSYIEFLPTSDGGRYLADGQPVCDGCNPLEFSLPDGDVAFDVIGTVANAASDYIVVGSTQPDGNPPYDNTENGVLRALNAFTSPTYVIMAAKKKFPAFAEVQGHRFQVVPGDQQAVTYACEGVRVENGEGQGKLVRYWNYGFNKNQKAPGELGGTNAILADRISSCNFVYDTANQLIGVVEITLGITHGGDSIKLYHEIHVNNVP